MARCAAFTLNFVKNRLSGLCVILLTNKLTNADENITYLAEVIGTYKFFCQTFLYTFTTANEKALRETQTLCARRSPPVVRDGCIKAEPKFHPPPPQTPFPGAQGRQNVISWRWSLPAPTDPVW